MIQTTKGLRVNFEDGGSTMLHWSTSDGRAMANTRADFRRHGITWPYDDRKAAKRAAKENRRRKARSGMSLVLEYGDWMKAPIGEDAGEKVRAFVEGKDRVMLREVREATGVSDATARKALLQLGFLRETDAPFEGAPVKLRAWRRAEPEMLEQIVFRPGTGPTGPRKKKGTAALSLVRSDAELVEEVAEHVARGEEWSPPEPEPEARPEVTEERDASPDEAFQLGEVSGYDTAFSELMPKIDALETENAELQTRIMELSQSQSEEGDWWPVTPAGYVTWNTLVEQATTLGVTLEIRARRAHR